MTIEPRTNPFNPHGIANRDPAKLLSRFDVVMHGKFAPTQCANYHCHNPSGFLESPFCDDCIWKLWAHIDHTQPDDKKQLARQGRFETIHRMAAEESMKLDKLRAERQDEYRTDFLTAPGTIYYLRVGDLIKIGYTIDMAQRMRQYPPNSELLASHPGTRQTERQMHQKFGGVLAKGREWFTPCDEIRAHVDMVRTQFKDRAA